MGVHVLVVEDDIDLCDAMTTTLTHGGYDVAVARSGNEALDRLRHGSAPALMLLDLRMPDGTGLNVLDAMEANSRLAVATLVVTALRQIRVPEGTRVLLKPFGAQELLTAVGRRLC